MCDELVHESYDRRTSYIILSQLVMKMSTKTPKNRIGLQLDTTRDIVENRYSFKYYVCTSDMSSQLPFTVVLVYIYIIYTHTLYIQWYRW